MKEIRLRTYLTGEDLARTNDLELSNFEASEAPDARVNFDKSRAGALLLWGGRGCGAVAARKRERNFESKWPWSVDES